MNYKRYKGRVGQKSRVKMFLYICLTALYSMTNMVSRKCHPLTSPRKHTNHPPSTRFKFHAHTHTNTQHFKLIDSHVLTNAQSKCFCILFFPSTTSTHKGSFSIATQIIYYMHSSYSAKVNICFVSEVHWINCV